MCDVFAAANLIDDHLICHSLEQSGVPAFVGGEAVLGGIGELPPIGLVSVSEPDSAREQSHDVIGMLGFGSKPGQQEDAIERWSGQCPV